MKKRTKYKIMAGVFFVGISVLLYPSFSEFVNAKTQSAAIATYDEKVSQIDTTDYEQYFAAANAYNAQLAQTPDALYDPDAVAGYEQTLDISGTGIIFESHERVLVVLYPR